MNCLSVLTDILNPQNTERYQHNIFFFTKTYVVDILFQEHPQRILKLMDAKMFINLRSNFDIVF